MQLESVVTTDRMAFCFSASFRRQGLLEMAVAFLSVRSVPDLLFHCLDRTYVRLPQLVLERAMGDVNVGQFSMEPVRARGRILACHDRAIAGLDLAAALVFLGRVIMRHR